MCKQSSKPGTLFLPQNMWVFKENESMIWLFVFIPFSGFQKGLEQIGLERQKQMKIGIYKIGIVRNV